MSINLVQTIQQRGVPPVSIYHLTRQGREHIVLANAGPEEGERLLASNVAIISIDQIEEVIYALQELQSFLRPDGINGSLAPNASKNAYARSSFPTSDPLRQDGAYVP